MEKKTKYYNIGVKNKKLHNAFMLLGRTIESKNVDETLEYLLDAAKERDMLKKESQSLAEIRELLCDPVKHHIFKSTPEEIDAMDLSGFMGEMEKRVKSFWKRFALTKKEIDLKNLRKEVD